MMPNIVAETRCHKTIEKSFPKAITKETYTDHMYFACIHYAKRHYPPGRHHA